MGLRLAAFEALQRGGVVEFGPEGGDEWRVRLVVPLPESERRLRVLVVDDHDVVHWGFRLLLTEQPWVERCVSAALGRPRRWSWRGATSRTSRSWTCSSARTRAPSCARPLRRELPHTRVLLISGAGWISPQAAKAAGASGFVLKDWSADDITMAVRMVAKGMTVFAPRVRAAATRGALGARARGGLADGLRRDEPRDRRAALHLSPHTVKEHTSSLYRKLGVRNRAEAVQRAERLGLSA